MLNILLPGQATLNVEDAQHSAPRTGLLKEDAQHITPRTGLTKVEDAQHIAPGQAT